MVRQNFYYFFQNNIVIKKIKLYQEPDVDEQGKLIEKPLDEEGIKLKLNTDLKEGVLKTNLGIPIVFVINKSDVVTQSSEKKKFEEYSEFILTHIRSIAIEYGATIVYTAGKTNSNLTLLYDYICHILFNFNLIHKPNLLDREAYFIPAGYDSLTLLQSNEEQKNYLKESYENKITPVIKKTTPEEDIPCEDTNSFFESLKKLGVKGKDLTRSKIGGTNSFVEHKKVKTDYSDLKNYETNININRSLMAIDDKKKNYEDKRKELRESIKNKASNSKIENSTKEQKGKEKEERLKRLKTKEAMIAKLGINKVKKPLDKAATKK